MKAGRIFYIYDDEWTSGCSKDLATAAFREVYNDVAWNVIAKAGVFTKEQVMDLAEYFQPTCDCGHCQKDNFDKEAHIETCVKTGRKFGYRECCIAHWVLENCHHEKTRLQPWSPPWSQSLVEYWGGQAAKCHEQADAILHATVQAIKKSFFPCNCCQKELARFIANGRHAKTKEFFFAKTKDWLRRYY